MTMHGHARLKDRKTIVTGAGKGIGEAIARLFAAEGAEVALVARSRNDLERVAADIADKGATVHILPADMGDGEQVEAMVLKAAKLMGGLDIVVSNAAASNNDAVMDISLEDWNRVQQVNVTGTLILLRTAFPYLSARPGSNALIVSSIRGLSGTPTTSAYGASKAALNHLTRTLAVEWGPVGVRVNAILPGPVFTPLMQEAVARDVKIRDRYENCSPIAGWTLPDDIAEPALFLASDASRKISGHLLIVDGGLVAINQDCLVLAN